MSYLLQAAFPLWRRNERGRHWRHTFVGGERIPQALRHTARIREVTVVAIRTTVIAIQTTPSLKVTNHRLFMKWTLNNFMPKQMCRKLPWPCQRPLGVTQQLLQKTHIIVHATEPGPCWVSAARCSIRTHVVAVTANNGALLLLWHLVVHGPLKWRNR